MTRSSCSKVRNVPDLRARIAGPPPRQAKMGEGLKPFTVR